MLGSLDNFPIHATAVTEPSGLVDHASPGFAALRSPCIRIPSYQLNNYETPSTETRLLVPPARSSDGASLRLDERNRHEPDPCAGQT
jgi:hypothetical protein